VNEPSRADELRQRLRAAGASPTAEEFSRLLPILERRLAAWERVKSEPLDDVPPAFAFDPVLDE
jgi:hypothetical protein